MKLSSNPLPKYDYPTGTIFVTQDWSGVWAWREPPTLIKDEDEDPVFGGGGIIDCIDDDNYSQEPQLWEIK